MKRTNLVLDEQLLEEVTRVSGERTYSRAVTRAIEDYLRRHRAGRILELAGKGLWEGDLSEMRGDGSIGEGPRGPR
jgi:metal-responsive CopG/Arc/MetJ family transcriptional regulator